MRKRIRMLAAALAAALLLTVPAFAADTQTEPGVYNVTVESGYTLELQTADGNKAESCLAVVGDTTSTLYTGAVKFTLGFTGNAGEQYVVFLLQDSEVPTQSSIRYIDQKEGGAISFTVYPSELTTTGDYGVYVSSTSQAYKKVASFQVTDSWEEAPYILGDVNMDGDININDALFVLKYIVGTESLTERQQQAANVEKSDPSININDALKILKYIVGNITEF